MRSNDLHNTDGNLKERRLKASTNPHLIPLKDRPLIVDTQNYLSNTLFINGIPNHMENEDIVTILSKLHQPIDTDLSCRRQAGMNSIWVAYASIKEAKQMLLYDNITS